MKYGNNSHKLLKSTLKSWKYTEKRYDKNTSTARIVTILINALSRVTCKEECFWQSIYQYVVNQLSRSKDKY